jgi:hypothetical protein
MIGILPELLRKTEVGKRPIRLIGITLSNLDPYDETSKTNASDVVDDGPQMGLF